MHPDVMRNCENTENEPLNLLLSKFCYDDKIWTVCMSIVGPVELCLRSQIIVT